MRRLWVYSILIFGLAILSWYPFRLYQVDQLNVDFIRAENLIREAEAIYDEGNLSDALAYLDMAAIEYPEYYRGQLLAGDWLWESGHNLEAIVYYHRALAYNYRIDHVYDRIVEFYQSEGLMETAETYLQIQEKLQKTSARSSQGVVTHY